MSHIGRERANVEPIHLLPPPHSSPWPGSHTVYTLLAFHLCTPLHPPAHPQPPRLMRTEGYLLRRQIVSTVDPISTGSGPPEDLLHQYSHLQ